MHVKFPSYCTKMLIQINKYCDLRVNQQYGLPTTALIEQLIMPINTRQVSKLCLADNVTLKDVLLSSPLLL